MLLLLREIVLNIPAQLSLEWLASLSGNRIRFFGFLFFIILFL